MSDGCIRLTSRARPLYARKNYRLAQEILEPYVTSTSFINDPKISKIKALDLLSAIYEKQGFLDKAKKSASNMIRLDSSNILGYLRLVKVLQLSNANSKNTKSLDQAIKVYKRGLQKMTAISTDHRKFIQLQISRCERTAAAIVSNGINQSSRQDFVQKLPLDVLIMIFGQLSMKELVKCLQVNKLWNTFLLGVPGFWTLIRFEALKAPILSSKDVLRYCSMSLYPTTLKTIDLDLSNVLLNEPVKTLELLAKNPKLVPRIRSLKLNNRAPLSINRQPLLKYLRKLSSDELRFDALRELSIISDTVDVDLVWCLSRLKSLEKLELVSSSHHKKTSVDGIQKESIVCGNLSELKIWGQSGNTIVSASLLNDVLQIDSLACVDVHRVAGNLWPTFAPVLKNSNLKRFGFTSEGVNFKCLAMPFPLFYGELDSLTLNDVICSNSIPLVTSNGDFWQPRPNDKKLTQLKYIELKWSRFDELSLVEILKRWECEKNLETLVIHATIFKTTSSFPTPEDEDFQCFPRLETLQLTNMRSSLSNGMVDWIVSAFPRLRKLNLDGTPISGSKLVGLLRSPSINAIKCKDVTEIAPDTIEMIKRLPGKTVYFN